MVDRRSRRESRGAESEPKVVADAAPELDLVAVRAVGGTSKGFVLLESSREFSGERIDALALGLHGELVGGPTPLAQSLPDVVWVDAVPTATGAIAMWAVRREDRADLFGVEIGSSGELRDQPTLLVPDARAWQVAPVSGGAAIGVLTAGKTRDASGTASRRVRRLGGARREKVAHRDGRRDRRTGRRSCGHRRQARPRVVGPARG